jgi:hypothetical protein
MDQKTIILCLHMKGMGLGCVKRNLTGCHVENLSELLVRIQVILRAIPDETLVQVFLKWMQRCINMNGESVG